MPTDNTLTIQKVSDYDDLDPNSQARRSRKRVQWKWGTHGPFIAYYDAATFDPASVKVQLTAEGQKLDALVK